MRTKLLSVAALAAAVAVSGCARTTGTGTSSPTYDFSQTEDVAVVAVEGRLPDSAAKGQIADMVNQQLLKKGYSPIERTQIKSVIKEQEFQTTSLTSASGAAEVGNVLNVDAAMIVNVPEYRDTMSMSAKMIDVDNGKIVWTGSGTARTGENLSAIGGAVAGGVLGGVAAGAATESYAGGAAGAAGGAAAGGVAGAALTPQKQKQARKLVTKLMKSLPSRVAG